MYPELSFALALYLQDSPKTVSAGDAGAGGKTSAALAGFLLQLLDFVSSCCLLADAAAASSTRECLEGTCRYPVHVLCVHVWADMLVAPNLERRPPLYMQKARFFDKSAVKAL